MSKKEVKTHTRLADKCPECGSENLVHDYDTGETVCGDCGLVLYEQMMDKGPEWRAFTQEEKASRSRVGVPTSYSVHDKGLSTAISQVDRDAFGRKLPLSTRLQMWRLRKWQIRSRVHSSVDRNLAQAMAELDRLSDKVYIPPPIKEKAAVVYRKALDKGLVREDQLPLSLLLRFMLLAVEAEHQEPCEKLQKPALSTRKTLQDATGCCYGNLKFTCQSLIH